MAYVLLSIGLLIAYLDWLGTNNLLAAGNLLKNEFFGAPDPFYKWLGAIIIIALLGYVPQMRPIATALLVLITISIFLSKSHQTAVNQLVKAL